MESIEAHPDDRLEGDAPAARRIAIVDLLERFQRSRLVVLGGDTNLRFRVGLHLSMTMSLRFGLPLDVFQPPVPHDQLTAMLLAWTADESTVRCLTRRVTELGVDRCTIAASTLAHHRIRFHREATPFARILEAMELPAPPIAPRPALVAELEEGALIRQERETPRRAGKRATQPTRILWLNLEPFAPKQGDETKRPAGGGSRSRRWLTWPAVHARSCWPRRRGRLVRSFPSRLSTTRWEAHRSARYGSSRISRWRRASVRSRSRANDCDCVPWPTLRDSPVSGMRRCTAAAA